MDLKKKLVELLDNFHRDLSPFAGNEKLFVVDDNVEQAEYLIAHGVTVQEWISVKDRLPDTQEYDWVLAQITFLPSCIYGVPVVAELRADGWYDAYDNFIDGKHEKVTHWMPLPQPPKGE